MTIAMQLATLAHDAIIEMYEVDVTPLGGALLRFYSGTNALNQSLTWQANIYQAYPIEAEGFDIKSEGPLPRPTLKVANVLGLIGALCYQYGGLKGAKVTRKRTLAKYLDAVNFAGGVNASADPNMHYPDEVWFIDRKAQHNREVVAFEMVSPIDAGDLVLPRRQVIASVCVWEYRGADCGYTGGAVAKEDDTPTSTMGLDACGHRLTSCQLRNWPGNELPFGGFPGAGIVQQL